MDFGAEGDRYRYRDVLSGLFATWFADHTAEEISAALVGHHRVVRAVPHLRSRSQTDPKVTANPLFSRLNQPGVGEYLAPGMPVAFDGVHPAACRRPPWDKTPPTCLTECLG